MFSIVLDDDRWKVETAGFRRWLRSVIIRDIDYSNWLVTNMETGDRWRLSHQEQEFLVDIAERVNAVQFTPEFQSESKAERKRLSQLALADCVDAIAMKRQGDSSKLDNLAGLNQAELNAYVFALWKL